MKNSKFSNENFQNKNNIDSYQTKKLATPKKKKKTKKKNL